MAPKSTVMNWVLSTTALKFAAAVATCDGERVRSPAWRGRHVENTMPPLLGACLYAVAQDGGKERRPFPGLTKILSAFSTDRAGV